MKLRAPESLLSSLCYLGATRVGVAVMNLVITSRLAHTLGTENFGINSFAVSYLSYFIILVNLGFETFVVREIACGQRNLKDLVGSTIAMRLLLAVLMGALVYLSLPWLHLAPIARTVILIQTTGLVTAAIGVTCVYQGLQRMRMLAWREFFSSFVSMIGVLWLVHAPADVVVAACIAAGTQLLVNLTVLTRFVVDFGLPRVWTLARVGFRLAWESMPYFWSLVMITITYNTHLVLLGLMRGAADVGLFAAGWKLFVFATAVPNLAATLFMPRIANNLDRPAERAEATRLMLQTIIIAVLPIAAFGSVLATEILRLLFGPSYVSASSALVLLLLNALVVAVNIGLGTWLTAVGRQVAILRVLVIGAATGVALNLLMIPAFGIDGAALATLADELAILGMFLWICPGLFGPNPIGFVLRCLLAVTPAALCVHVVRDVAIAHGSLALAIGASSMAGTAVYLLALRLVSVDPVQFFVALRELR